MAMKTLFQPRVATSDDAPRAPSGGVAAGGSDEHQAPPELHLNAEHIKALGWKPKAGARHTIHAEVVVHRVGSENDSSSEPGEAKGSGPSTKHTATLHFHKMEMGKGGNETGQPAQDQDAKRAAGAKAEMDKALAREEGGHVTGGSKSKNSEGRGTKRVAPQGNNGPR